MHPEVQMGSDGSLGTPHSGLSSPMIPCRASEQRRHIACLQMVEPPGTNTQTALGALPGA